MQRTEEQPSEREEVLALRNRIAELEHALESYRSGSRHIRLFESVFDRMVEGVIVFDLTGVSIYSNPAARKLLGTNFYRLQDLPKSFPIQRLSGEDGAVWANLVVFPTPTTGDPGKGGANFSETEPEYRILAETIPQIVFTAGTDGSFDFVNQRFTAYTGLAADALRGYGWQEVIHSDDFAAYAESYFRCVDAGEIFEGECRIRGANAHYRWHLTQAVPVRDGSGLIRKWIGTCTDINDRKNASEVIQNQRKWLQEILDMMPMGVTFVELGTGRTTFRNRTAELMVGGDFLLAQYSGEVRNLPTCTDEEGNPLESSAYPGARVARGERLDGFQMNWESPNGPRHLVFYSDNLPAMLGQPSTGVLLFQDITPLKQAEAELRQKQKELIRSNEDLQQFAYAASHDLQEPLRMVSGYTQLLARRYAGRLDADADDYIQFAVDGANRMGQLIKDLLAFSRAGNPETRRLEPVDMASVIQWAVLNLHTAINESGAAVTYDPLPSVTGDQARLALVMQNLIGNAIKYRSADPPKVHISAVPQGDHWVFCVADNGIGFDMKYADRIFGVFKRLHGKEVPGTGIGLAIVKKVLEIHKGRIWVESEPEHGSRFYFTLPTEQQG